MSASCGKRRWRYAALVLTLGWLVCPVPAQPVGGPPAEVQDSDADGLEDALEAKLGTDPKAIDSDGDGLGDYDEYCKYHTDPAKNDSDGDGRPDGEWEERREHTYTIHAICEIRPPNQVEVMTDLYQDARAMKQAARSKDGTVVEVVLYPFARPHVNARPYPLKNVAREHQVYLQRTLGMNYSAEMQDGVRQIVAGASTDLEAIQKILNWINSSTKLVNRHPEFAYFYVKDNQVVWKDTLGSPEADRELLETNFFGDSMFKQRVHGTCSSLAMLRGTMLRAAGLPTRLIQTLPLINRYERDYEPLTDRMRKRIFAGGYDWGAGGGGANHMYNEAYLNHHWIRVDNDINVGPFVEGKLFIKVYSAADVNNLFVARPKEEGWNENRDLRTLEVADALPKYKSRFEQMDLAVSDRDLHVARTDQGQIDAWIAIRNAGNIPTPQVRVHFYAINDKGEKRLIGIHGAGPIWTGASWGERATPFDLQPGEEKIHVVIDPDNVADEVNEANNTATAAVPK